MQRRLDRIRPFPSRRCLPGWKRSLRRLKCSAWNGHDLAGPTRYALRAAHGPFVEAYADEEQFLPKVAMGRAQLVRSRERQSAFIGQYSFGMLAHLADDAARRISLTRPGRIASQNRPLARTSQDQVPCIFLSHNEEDQRADAAATSFR